MSDEEAIAIVRRAGEALVEDGVEGLLPFIHPEFESTIPPELSLEPATYRGVEGVRRYFDSFYEAVDEVRFEPEDYIPAAGRVVVPSRVVVRGRGSGAEASQHLVLVWAFRDHKVASITPFATLDEALAAARGS
jgi:ketosteroid isomerase-like protein